MEELIKALRQKRVLKSAAIEKALRKIDRKDFVPEESRDAVYEDIALPIGMGQTISQPYTVIFMLELLAPKAGEKIMDVGHGSGWQTALLAEIAGETGKIYAIERIPALCEMGKTNVAKYPDLERRVVFVCGDASPGLPEEAEKIGGFDAIIAAAEVEEVPRAWREQLKIGGRLVYPKDKSVFKEIKTGEKDFSQEEYPGFAFVPFIPGKQQ